MLSRHTEISILWSRYLSAICLTAMCSNSSNTAPLLRFPCPSTKTSAHEKLRKEALLKMFKPDLMLQMNGRVGVRRCIWRLQRPASMCDQVTQGLAQARFLQLQGWSFHILSGPPVPEHDLIGILPFSLKNSNFQWFSFISTYAFYNVLALLEKKMKKVAIKAIMTP